MEPPPFTPVQNTDFERSYRVKVDIFEGPLDLLLHLIRKNELDICEVSLSKIADQYLEFIKTMDLLNLDMAGEFILVAATLVHMKSRALLPEMPALLEDDVDDFESPTELIRRLLNYKKYKEVAMELKKRHTLHAQVFLREGEDPILAELAQGQSQALEVSLFELVEALQGVLKRVTLRKVHEVRAEQVTIGERIKQLIQPLLTRKHLTFDEMFELVNDRYAVIVTFLALLEMSRLALIRFYQNEPFGALRVESRLDEVDLENARFHALFHETQSAFSYRREQEGEKV